MNTKIIDSACLGLLMRCSNVGATIITEGYLTFDDAGYVINDTLNAVDYLQFDVLSGKIYAETLSILDTQGGGG